MIDQLDRMDELDTSISDELERTVPDPALVGKNVVELEMIDRSISEKFETTVVAVQAALTQEQRDKLRLLEEAARLSRTIDLATDWAILRLPDDSGNSLPLLLSPDRTIGAMGQLSEARKGQLKKLLTDRSAKR